MIILDDDKYLEDIKRYGIGATDIYATKKLQVLIDDFVKNTSYKKGKIIDKVKTIAADYFSGLPDNIIEKQLEDMYLISKKNMRSNNINNPKKIVNLYKSEMETIASLETENLQRLAFAMLVFHKFTAQYYDGNLIKYHKRVIACKSDIYRVAGLDNVSGTAKNKMWVKLAEKGLVKHFAKTNNSFMFNPTWIAMTLFTVPFNRDIMPENESEELWMQITNYDDVMLYWRYYTRNQRKDWNVVLCTDCGCPIEKTSNNHFLCRDCSKKRKQSNDKQRYQLKCSFA